MFVHSHCGFGSRKIRDTKVRNSKKTFLMKTTKLNRRPKERRRKVRNEKGKEGRKCREVRRDYSRLPRMMGMVGGWVGVSIGTVNQAGLD